MKAEIWPSIWDYCLCCSLFHNSYSKRHLRFFFKTKKPVTKASKCRVLMCFNSASTFSTFSTSSTFRFRSLTILLGSIALHISRVVTSETPGVFPSKRVAFFMWWKRMDFCLWYNLCIFRLNFIYLILIYIIVLVYNEFRSLELVYLWCNCNLQKNPESCLGRAHLHQAKFGCPSCSSWLWKHEDGHGHCSGVPERCGRSQEQYLGIDLTQS